MTTKPVRSGHQNSSGRFHNVGALFGKAEAAVQHALDEAETQQLAELETKIERGMDTFREVGAALVEIRDSRLYRADYRTFEAYLKERWHLTRSRAYQLIEASAVSKILDNPPLSEAAIRELPSNPDEARVVLAAVTADGKRPTAKRVKGAAALLGTAQGEEVIEPPPVEVEVEALSVPPDADLLARLYAADGHLITAPPEGACQSHRLLSEAQLEPDDPKAWELLIDKGYTFTLESPTDEHRAMMNGTEAEDEGGVYLERTYTRDTYEVRELDSESDYALPFYVMRETSESLYSEESWTVAYTPAGKVRDVRRVFETEVEVLAFIEAEWAKMRAAREEGR